MYVCSMLRSLKGWTVKQNSALACSISNPTPRFKVLLQYKRAILKGLHLWDFRVYLLLYIYINSLLVFKFVNEM